MEEFIIDIYRDGVRVETCAGFKEGKYCFLEQQDLYPLSTIICKVTIGDGINEEEVYYCYSYQELYDTELELRGIKNTIREAIQVGKERAFAWKPNNEDFYDNYTKKWGAAVPPDVEPTDAINPKHYQDVVPNMQYMEMMVYMLDDVKSHLKGQVYKYLMRCGKKDAELQELKKAQWYLNALIKYQEEGKVM